MSEPIPYNLASLIARCPKTGDKATWTPDQASAVETLHKTYAKVKVWVWGTDEDWAILDPLFNSEGDYQGEQPHP